MSRCRTSLCRRAEVACPDLASIKIILRPWQTTLFPFSPRQTWTFLCTLRTLLALWTPATDSPFLNLGRLRTYSQTHILCVVYTHLTILFVQILAEDTASDLGFPADFYNIDMPCPDYIATSSDLADAQQMLAYFRIHY